jgi:hypothetical protein
MRAIVFAAATLGGTAAACTLLTDLEGIAGPEAQLTPDATMPGPDATLDAMTPGEASADASVDGAPDVAAIPFGKTIATGQATPTVVALDSERVYWINSAGTTGAVMQAPRDGGAPTAIANNQDNPVDLLLTGTSLTWSLGPGTIRTASRDSVDVFTQVATATLPPPSGLGIAASRTFWTEPAGSVVRYCQSGCCPCNLVSNPGTPHALIARASTVYWLRNNSKGSVSSCAATGCTDATPVLDGHPNARALAVDSTNVYVATEDRVISAPLPSGAAQNLVTGLATPSAVAVFATTLYVVTRDDGKLHRMSITGANPEVIGMGLKLPSGIAADATNVFVTSSADGRVVRFDP